MERYFKDLIYTDIQIDHKLAIKAAYGKYRKIEKEHCEYELHFASAIIFSKEDRYCLMSDISIENILKSNL